MFHSICSIPSIEEIFSFDYIHYEVMRAILHILHSFTGFIFFLIKIENNIERNETNFLSVFQSILAKCRWIAFKKVAIGDEFNENVSIKWHKRIRFGFLASINWIIYTFI